MHNGNLNKRDVICCLRRGLKTGGKHGSPNHHGIGKPRVTRYPSYRESNDSHGIIVAHIGPVLCAELHVDGDIVTLAIDRNIWAWRIEDGGQGITHVNYFFLMAWEKVACAPCRESLPEAEFPPAFEALVWTIVSRCAAPIDFKE